MHRSILPILTSGALVVSIMSAATPSAQADISETRELSVVILGDSYSAGNGTAAETDITKLLAGSDIQQSDQYYYGPAGAYRSRLNWAHDYVNWLNEQPGTHARLQNFAWGGAQTVSADHWGSECQGISEADLPSTCTWKPLLLQVDDVSSDTDLVMFTIGGNDVDFANIVEQCFSIVHEARACDQSVTDAETQISSVFAQVEQVFEKLDQKLDDDSQVVYMGYPLLSTAASEILMGNGTIIDAAERIRELGRLGQVTQKLFVEQWNASHPTLNVTYIDGVNEWFDQGPGHEPTASPLTTNPYRWMNEFFEVAGYAGADATTVSSGPCVLTDVALLEIFSDKSTGYLDSGNWYHPNITGHQQMAQILIQQIGIPATANAATSTFAWIQGPYVGPVGSVMNLDARPSYAASEDLISYEWDFDGDGVFDQTTTEPQVVHRFTGLYDGDVRVRVTDSQGGQAVGSTAVLISEDGDTTPQDRDNCPLVANHGQGDVDNDGIGDLCDPTPGLPGVTASTPSPSPSTDSSPSVSPSLSPSPSPDPSPSPSVSPSPSPSGPTASVRYTQVSAGDKQIMSGQNFRGWEWVSVSLCAETCTKVDSGIVGWNGHVTMTFTVPTNMAPGSYTVTMTGTKSGSVSVPFEVLAPVQPKSMTWSAIVLKLWLWVLLT